MLFFSADLTDLAHMGRPPSPERLRVKDAARYETGQALRSSERPCPGRGNGQGTFPANTPQAPGGNAAKEQSVQKGHHMGRRRLHFSRREKLHLPPRANFTFGRAECFTACRRHARHATSVLSSHPWQSGRYPPWWRCGQSGLYRTRCRARPGGTRQNAFWPPDRRCARPCPPWPAPIA